jgi:hypothetical protein
LQDRLAQRFTDGIWFDYVYTPSKELLKFSHKPAGEPGCGWPGNLHEQIHITSLPAFPTRRRAKHTNSGNSMLGSDSKDFITFFLQHIIDSHGHHRTHAKAQRILPLGSRKEHKDKIGYKKKKDLKKSPCEILFALATFAPWREGKTQNLPHHSRKFRSGQKNSQE